MQIPLLILNSAAFTRHYLRRVAERIGGYRVDMAASVHEALKLMDSSEYDIVVVGLEAGRSDAEKLTSRIRSDSRFEESALVATASVGDADVVRRAIRIGVSEYLVKPFRSDVVEARLERARRRAVERRRRAAEAGNPLFLIDHSNPELEQLLRSAVIENNGTVIVADHMLSWIDRASDAKPAYMIASRAFLDSSPRLLGLAFKGRLRPQHLIAFGVPEDHWSTAAPNFVGRIPDEGGVDEVAQALADVIQIDRQGPARATPAARAAFVQVVGMMTGEEPEACPERRADHAPPNYLLGAALRRKSSQSGATLELACDAEVMAALTAAAAGLPVDQIPVEDCPSGPTEMLMVAADRVAAVLSDAEGEWEAVGVEPREPGAPSCVPAREDVWLEWNGSEMRLRLTAHASEP